LVKRKNKVEDSEKRKEAFKERVRKKVKTTSVSCANLYREATLKKMFYFSSYIEVPFDFYSSTIRVDMLIPLRPRLGDLCSYHKPNSLILFRSEGLM